MANKYACWYSNDFYSDKSLLAEHYGDYLQLPFYYGKNCSLKVETCHRMPPDRNQKKMEYVELLIVGILAAGQSMTALQLKAYLLLKNIAISNTVLNGKLEWLIYQGLLERNTIWDSKILPVKEKAGHVPKVIVFRLTMKGCATAVSIGISGRNREKDFQLTCQRGKLSRLTRSILWNQIILNQMLYNARFTWFRVGEFQKLRSQKYMELPLRVSTAEGEYYFEYLHTMENEVIDHTISLWLDYAMKKGMPFTFVLVSDSYDAIRIGSYMSKAKAAGIRLAATSAVDWFRDEAGVIMTASDFL